MGDWQVATCQKNHTGNTYNKLVTMERRMGTLVLTDTVTTTLFVPLISAAFVAIAILVMFALLILETLAAVLGHPQEHAHRVDGIAVVGIAEELTPVVTAGGVVGERLKLPQCCRQGPRRSIHNPSGYNS